MSTLLMSSLGLLMKLRDRAAHEQALAHEQHAYQQFAFDELHIKSHSIEKRTKKIKTIEKNKI